MEIYILIMAAGSGMRFGAPVPKQYCDLDGHPVIVTTVERMVGAVSRHMPDSKVVLTVVISPEERGRWDEIACRYDIDGANVAYGGATRWESVSNALRSITPAADDLILVHDAARPLVSERVVADVIDTAMADCCDGAIPVTPVVDSLRRVGAEGSSVAVDRSEFRAVQTPQGFLAGRLAEAYAMPYRPEFTDDASVMAAAGYSHLRLVDGDPATIKITRPVDLAIVKTFIDLGM